MNPKIADSRLKRAKKGPKPAIGNKNSLPLGMSPFEMVSEKEKSAEYRRFQTMRGWGFHPFIRPKTFLIQ